MAKFISTQSIVLELPLIIDHLPATGTEVQASVIEGAVVAGGFYVVAAVARQGVAACVASTLGTGPNSVQARHSLGRESVAVLTRGVVGDLGDAFLDAVSRGRSRTESARLGKPVLDRQRLSVG